MKSGSAGLTKKTESEIQSCFGYMGRSIEDRPPLSAYFTLREVWTAITESERRGARCLCPTLALFSGWQ